MFTIYINVSEMLSSLLAVWTPAKFNFPVPNNGTVGPHT